MSLAQKINPVVASCLGQDYEAMHDQELVTVVRRKIVYEEVVMKREEFDAMNKRIKENFEEYETVHDLEFQDIGFFIDSPEYIAFPGDVTSCTDDAILFLFENQTWTDFRPISIAS